MLINTISKMMLITPKSRTALITDAPKKVAQQNRCKEIFWLSDEGGQFEAPVPELPDEGGQLEILGLGNFPEPHISPGLKTRGGVAPASVLSLEASSCGGRCPRVRSSRADVQLPGGGRALRPWRHTQPW